MTVEDIAGSYPGVSPIRAAMGGHCPRCGKGRLFQAYINVRPACESCGLDFAFAESADGPAIFVMFVVGFIVVGLALWVEAVWHPPYWVHAVLWIPMVFILSLALLRPLKGIFIGSQYRNKAAEARFEED